MDEADSVIKILKVGKTFKLPHEKHSSIKSVFVNSYRSKQNYEIQKVLDNIVFDVKKGEFFGIVGRNGSGKSTLLKLLAGIYTPTSGSVEIYGKLTPFIELGVGFNPELTGRENVFLNGALLGFTRREMEGMYNDIVEFAEISKFMDQKLKNYSSGMQVRLAFSIAIRAQSDILLIDEVLAVGDAAFQQKCFEYFRILKKQKKTVVFVSHDRGALENFCDRGALIDKGKLLKVGPISSVLSAYNDIVLQQTSEAKAIDKKIGGKVKNRWGTKEIQIQSVQTKANGMKSDRFKPHDKIEIVVRMKANANVKNPIYGIVLRRRGDEPIFVTNTRVEHIETGNIKKGQMVEVRYSIDNIFGNGSYTISPGVANEDANLFYDWRDNLVTFYISGWDDTYISIHPAHEIRIN